MALEKKHVYIYTDGACKGNPGAGGWGTILVWGEHEKELSGGEADTTNNRMELTAVIRGLSALKEPCIVTLTSDSSYVIDAFQKGWIASWQKHGWKKSDKSPVLNSDLWQELIRVAQPHEMEWVWVRGHNGHPYNERCDRLAVAGAEAYQK